MRTSSARNFCLGVGALALLALSPARPLAAQSLEGSRWSIEEEGVDTAVIWWLGSEGRVRSGDLGMILPAYKWRQAGDSVFISIGDSVHYAAMLMSNRLVGGIRSARSRPEGWWSGMRAELAAPATVAAAPANGAAPASSPAATPSSAQPLSRPADTVTTPSTAPTVTPAPAGRHPLRQITRGDAGNAPATPSAAPVGDGRQMRRIERAGGATPTQGAATGPLNASLVGSWTRADSVGMVDGFELTADGKATLHLRNGMEGTGEWTSDSQESRLTFRGPQGGEAQLVIWEGGPGLRGAIVTAAGPRRTLAFRRAGDGPTRQPAIRQP